MGSMPGWFAKPAEFWLFDEYFSPGADLRQRLESMRDQLAEPEGFDDDHWDEFWSNGGASGLNDDARDHFLKHWLGLDPDADFFPGVNKNGPGGEAPGQNILRMLQKGMRQAAVAALENPGSPKPLSLVWNCAPGADGFFGVGVANGPHTVVVSITTPEFLAGRDAPSTPRPDQGWSWKINPDGSIDDSSEPINVNDTIAYNPTVQERYTPNSES